jgi:hypothetical protein
MFRALLKEAPVILEVCVIGITDGDYGEKDPQWEESLI